MSRSFPTSWPPAALFQSPLSSSPSLGPISLFLHHRHHLTREARSITRLIDLLGMCECDGDGKITSGAIRPRVADRVRPEADVGREDEVIRGESRYTSSQRSHAAAAPEAQQMILTTSLVTQR